MRKSAQHCIIMRVRWCLLLWLLASCGRLSFDASQTHDARGSDSRDPAPAPRFVHHFETDCALQSSCTILVPGATADTLLLVTLVYGVQTIDVVSVADNAAREFTPLIAPVAWSTNVGNFKTGMWWARNAGATSITVTLNGQPMSIFELYVNEFVAASVDQTAFAQGVATGPTPFSSGARDVNNVPQLLFGHAEAYPATVFPAPGFASIAAKSGNIEEAMVISTPGNYEAGFTLDRDGQWVALMATLQ